MLFTRGGQTKKCGGWITLDGLLLKGFGVVSRLLRCACNDGKMQCAGWGNALGIGQPAKVGLKPRFLWDISMVRHCEERSDAAISFHRYFGLLLFFLSGIASLRSQ